MIAIVVLGFLACANAAPRHSCYHHQDDVHSHYQYKNQTELVKSDDFENNKSSIANEFPGHHSHYFHHHHHHHYPHAHSYSEDHLDRHNISKKFCNCDLSKETVRNDDLIKQFINNEPSIQTNDTEYKITLQLQGFDKKEFHVTAKKGQLAVQATRKIDCVPEINYFYIRTLPDDVGENMTWTYENSLLTMVLSIAQVEKETPMKTTPLPQRIEEMKNNTDQIYDIDIRLGDVS